MKQFTLKEFIRNIIEAKAKIDFPVKVKLPAKLNLEGVISNKVITVDNISIVGILQPKYNAEYGFGLNDEVLGINVYINLPNFKCGLIRELYIGTYGTYNYDNMLYNY